jgi:hypothetical protein
LAYDKFIYNPFLYSKPAQIWPSGFPVMQGNIPGQVKGRVPRAGERVLLEAFHAGWPVKLQGKTYIREPTVRGGGQDEEGDASPPPEGWGQSRVGGV